MRSPISLISSMRCVMKIDADALGAEPPHDPEQPVPRGHVERRGGLVEDQDPRLAASARGRSRRLPVAQRERLDGRVEVERAARAARPSIARARSRFSRPGTRFAEQPVDAEPDVVEHRARLGDEHLLEDGDDPELLRGTWGRRGGDFLARRARSSPASGEWTPLRILTSVLLPEPFSPTSVCTSPARSSNDAPRRACVAPNALVRPVTRTSTVGVSVAGIVAGASVVVIPVGSYSIFLDDFLVRPPPRPMHGRRRLMDALERWSRRRRSRI